MLLQQNTLDMSALTFLSWKSHIYFHLIGFIKFLTPVIFLCLYPLPSVMLVTLTVVLIGPLEYNFEISLLCFFKGFRVRLKRYCDCKTKRLLHVGFFNNFPFPFCSIPASLLFSSHFQQFLGTLISKSSTFGFDSKSISECKS